MKLTLGKGFTLIELLIVIAIIAILATAVVLIINPTELLKQSRDARRLSDLEVVNKALSIYNTAILTPDFGLANRIYLSLPDSDAGCATYITYLPTPPNPWAYVCKPPNTYRNPNNGWVPVNLTGLPAGASISTLPVDPINSAATGQYYTYTTLGGATGSWKLSAMLESTKEAPKAAKDGGADNTLFEVGSQVGITAPINGLVGYWKFDDQGVPGFDSSGLGKTVSLLGGATNPTAGCKISGCASLDGVNDYLEVSDSYNPSDYTISLFVNFNSTGNQDFIWRTHSINGGASHLLYSEGGVFKHFLWDGGFKIVTGTISPTTGQWYHVVGVATSNGVMRLYINSVETGTALSIGSVWNGGNVWEIGKNGGRGWMNGVVDEVRVYNRALSQEEITSIYNATK